MDNVTNQQAETRLQAGWQRSPRTILLALLLAIPIAIVAGAVAEVVVAAGAVIAAAVLTRDLYVIVAAPSYGPFAAATIVPLLIVATVLWSVGGAVLFASTPATGTVHRWLLATVGGVGATVSIPLTAGLADVIPLTRTYTPLLSTAVIWPTVMVAGIVAGTVTHWLLGSQRLRPHLHTSQRVTISSTIAYALVIALILASVVAVTTALGLL